MGKLKCPLTDEWIKKLFYTHTHTHTYMHTGSGILLNLKKEQNNAICSNIDATWDYHTKWRKSERERQIPYAITYLYAKSILAHRQQEQTCGWWGEGEGRSGRLGLADVSYYTRRG